jgi:hypothetical protein
LFFKWRAVGIGHFSLKFQLEISDSENQTITQQRRGIMASINDLAAEFGIPVITLDGSHIPPGSRSHHTEEDELRGHAWMIENGLLPIEMHSKDGYDTKQALQQAGVVFGGVYEADPIFRRATLPSGWKILPGHCSELSILVDAMGRKRATIYYKNAPYEYEANMRVERRFEIGAIFRNRGETIRTVKDCGRVVYTTEPIKVQESNYHAAIDEVERLATEWLVTRYPDWRNPGAYWD